uniref:Variant surface glycoprotein 1125.1489 n=1 Tax=Trypanosoma brucei TaxID=5691 RepID=A0A1J0R7B0_9TRYP|nr:variant surface glycoprotein 1125.1489 [Trypanosoma brucei]
MAASLVVLGIATAILTWHAAEGAGAEANANATAYAMLCKTFNVIAKPYAAPDSPVIDPKIETEALAFNFSMHHPTATEELAKEEYTERSKLKQTSEAFQVTTDETFAKAKATAQAAMELRKNKHYANLKAEAANQHLIASIEHIVQQIKETAAAARATDIKTEAAAVQKYLNQAIYGSDTADDKIKLTASGGKTRAQSCGTTGADNAQSTTGTSIKHDMMCLCAVAADSTGTDVCHTFETALSVAATNDAELSPDWLKLKGGCEAMGEQANPTAQMTAAAAEAAATYIAKAGSASKLSHLLGYHQTDANTGCTGTSAANQ